MHTIASAIQLSSQEDLTHNLRQVRYWVEMAVDSGATLILLPENFAFFGEETEKAHLAESLDQPGPILNLLCEMAARFQVTLIGGGMPLRSQDAQKPFNACVVVSPEGNVSNVYKKIHLFDVDLADGSRYSESSATTPGTEAIVVNVGNIGVGLSVCYDLRFPELYRILAVRGAQVLVVPAAFTLMTGKDHWHVLLRARAIENQCFVVAAGQWGKHPNGRQTFGKSCIIDPWGEIIAQTSEGEGMAIATLDFSYLEKVRTQLPALRHRRV